MDDGKMKEKAEGQRKGGRKKKEKGRKNKGKSASDLSLLTSEGRLKSRKIQKSTEGNLPK